MKHVLTYLDKGVRFDGRGLTDYREIEVKTGVVNSAEGSAWIKIGDTELIAGVKMEVGKPYPDKQDEGTMMVNVELLPMSSPEFEPGPPGIEAIELARVTDRGIREANAIDTKKLCIEKGELVWTVVVDICPINVDGNLFDASSLATLLALKDTVFPKLEGKTIDYKTKTKTKLPLLAEPLSVTVIRIGDHYLVDPLPQEEKLADSRLTVATLKDGTITAMQKGGVRPLSLEDIDQMITLGTKKIKELRKHLG